MAGEYFDDGGRDGGLNWAQANGVRVELLAATVDEAGKVGDESLGFKTGITLAGPADDSPSGRKLTLPAFTGGTTTANGIGTHLAVWDGGTDLVAVLSLTTPLPVKAGQEWQLASAVIIGRPDAITTPPRLVALPAGDGYFLQPDGLSTYWIRG